MVQSAWLKGQIKVMILNNHSDNLLMRRLFVQPSVRRLILINVFVCAYMNSLWDGNR